MKKNVEFNEKDLTENGPRKRIISTEKATTLTEKAYIPFQGSGIKKAGYASKENLYMLNNQ